jgi:hypothetical protein
MQIIFFRTKIILFLVCYGSLPAQFNSLETENLRLIYFGKANEFLVDHVARCYENAYNHHTEIFGYYPKEKTTVLLHDFNDFGNAGAGTIPRNHISIAIAPPSYEYETTPSNERINSTMNHEMVHIIQLDNTNRIDRFFRSIFRGKIRESKEDPLTMLYSYFATPLRSTPRWYREGIAVFLDTWMAGGIGRAQGPYDEMVFRTKILENIPLFNLVELESAGTQINFQVGANSYLYGTRFMNYLAYHFGPDKLLLWTKRSNDSKRYFADQFEYIYGQPIHDLWTDWIAWENEFQKKNIKSINEYKTTIGRNIPLDPLGSVSRAYFDDKTKTIYVAVSYPGQLAHIAGINIVTGEKTRMCNIRNPALYFVTSMAFDPNSGQLFYTSDNNDWRDLWMVDIETGKTKKLLKDVRIGDIVFNETDKSIWGIRHYNGITTLVRIPYPYTEWNQIYSPHYGTDIHSIDISPDGKFLSAGVAAINGEQNLRIASIDSLLQGKSEFQFLFDFQNSIPANFVFSQDSRSLFGSSYYNGVSNIYRYDLDEMDMDLVSNCETGFFRPLPISSDSLIVFRYSDQGFLPAVISNDTIEVINAISLLGSKVINKHPELEDLKVDPPGQIDLDNLVTYRGTYSGPDHFKLISAYPVIEGYKDFAALGWHLNFSDPIGLNNFDITASYTPHKSLTKSENWHVGFKYSHLGWSLAYNYNKASFYDLFGPTRTSRKGSSVNLGYKQFLILDKPKTLELQFNFAWFGDLERLPDYQNVETTFDEFLMFSGQLESKYQIASLGAVNYEKGYKWGIYSNSTYVNEEIYSQVTTEFDLGFPLPINHSSIWIRNALGHSVGDRKQPFANFYFGGFGNNWIDYLHEKRYREWYSFPGIELNSLGGHNFGKSLLEWELPPIRFRQLGTQAFYITWARPAIFSSYIITNVNDDSNDNSRSLLNFGGQIDFRIILLSHLKLTLSIGYSQAIEQGMESLDEFMISLKVL